jgi:hypothetical protein
VSWSFEDTSWPAHGRGSTAINVIHKSVKDRWERFLFVALVVLVQVTWGAALVYLALHFF